MWPLELVEKWGGAQSLCFDHSLTHWQRVKGLINCKSSKIKYKNKNMNLKIMHNMTYLI